MLDDEEEAHALPFVGAAQIEHGPVRVAAAIRATLGVSADEQRAAKGAPALFTLLRTAAEKVGIYVLLLGDVGSHHSDVGEDVFGGIALTDDVVPSSSLTTTTRNRHADRKRSRSRGATLAGLTPRIFAALV